MGDTLRSNAESPTNRGHDSVSPVAWCYHCIAGWDRASYYWKLTECI